MIIVKLMGGLGNQMFQYALARHLAKINNTTLKLDLSFLLDRTPRENFIYRTCDLDIFTLKADLATEGEVSHFIYKDNLIGCLRHAHSRLTNRYIKERTLGFHKRILKIKGDVYLDGYWQSELYFEDIAEIIRKDFTFKNDLCEISREMAKQITGTNSVCVHVRRGDFLSNPEAKEFHGVCSADYYLRAMKAISQRVSNPVYYIFSDDLEWCRKNLTPHCSAVLMGHEHDGQKFGNKLRLMALCKHFIIANSTFGWWGAWLSLGLEKMVIAPKYWFANKRLQRSFNIIPRGWITLENF